MSDAKQIASEAASASANRARLAKAQLAYHQNLLTKEDTKKFLRKKQLERGGQGDGDWYELQANSAGDGSRGELAKADGYIRTIYDMVDYYYGYVPQVLGGGGKGNVRKADSSVTSGTTGVENVVYGSEVFSLLNSEANIYALLEKRPWRKSGERIVDARGRTLGEGGESENATLPDTNHPSWDTFEQDPTNIAHTFDVSQVEQLLAATDDDHISDDPFDWLRRWYGTGTEHQTGYGEHPKNINAQLGSDIDRDESTDATFENAMEPIDRAISDSVEAGNLSDGADADIYDFDRSDSEFESNVLTSSDGTNRNFVLDYLDDAVREIREASGKDPVTDDNYFFLTGHDTYQRVENEVGGKERLEAVRSTYGLNGVQTVPGDDVGITVRAYKDIPIFRSNDVASDGISRIYLIDSETMWIKQLLPTQFYSTGIDIDDNPFAIDRLGNEGMYLTTGQLTLTNPKAQAKVSNLK